MESTKELLTERTAEFTSSQIYRLMTNGRGKDSFGAPFYDYVIEKAMESVLGRSIDTEAVSNSLSWGNLCESVAFDLLPLEYSLVSKTRYRHESLPWSGMPDTITSRKIGDIKCPWTLKRFMKLAYSSDLKKESPQYYWQLVSNSVLCDLEEAELFLFMPKKDRLKVIIEKAISENSIIQYKSIEQLPFLPNACKVPELVPKQILIPQEDKEALIGRVVEAKKEMGIMIDHFKSLQKCD